MNLLGTKDDPVGWFFWATQDDDFLLVQRRAPCLCEACDAGRFAGCLWQQEDTSSGRWWNAPQQQVPYCHVSLCYTMPSVLNCVFLQGLKPSKDLKGRSFSECIKYMKGMQSTMVR